MHPNAKPRGLRTWIEISQSAIKNNIARFRNRIDTRVRLMSVVKSNAYGHGLYAFSSIAERLIDWFGVDSVVEGVSLRKAGIQKPILVLGATLPARLIDARSLGITVTLSNNAALRIALSLKRAPEFHIKLDTGMHRQGFQSSEVESLCSLLNKKKSIAGKLFTGIYTHFACAKCGKKDAYTKMQIVEFERMSAVFRKKGFANLMRHAAATAGTLIFPKAHYDMVRIGIGLYGMFPSRGIALSRAEVMLSPVLSWRGVVSEIKNVSRGSPIGYDSSERVKRESVIAIVPIGYWHGLDRGLSGIGAVLIRGRQGKILGRVSMDMIAVDCTDIAEIYPGDVATILGADGKNYISAEKLAAQLSTIPYEVVTRINPLIERVIRI